MVIKHVSQAQVVNDHILAIIQVPNEWYVPYGLRSQWRATRLIPLADFHNRQWHEAELLCHSDWLIIEQYWTLGALLLRRWFEDDTAHLLWMAKVYEHIAMAQPFERMWSTLQDLCPGGPAGNVQ